MLIIVSDFPSHQAFFGCWAPFHIQRIFATLIKEPTEPQIILHNLLTNISGVTYYLSATINPILYSIMSLKFRTAFRDTLHQIWCLNYSNARRRRAVSAVVATMHHEDSTSRCEAIGVNKNLEQQVNNRSSIESKGLNRQFEMRFFLNLNNLYMIQLDEVITNCN